MRGTPTRANLVLMTGSHVVGGGGRIMKCQIALSLSLSGWWAASSSQRSRNTPRASERRVLLGRILINSGACFCYRRPRCSSVVLHYHYPRPREGRVSCSSFGVGFRFVWCSAGPSVVSEHGFPKRADICGRGQAGGCCGVG